MKPFFTKPLTLKLVIVLLTGAVYSFALPGYFRPGDGDLVRASLAFSVTPGPGIAELLPAAQAPFQPLAAVSFRVEHYFYGHNAFYYYLDNIFLHIANALSVFALMMFLSRRQGLAFSAALLFALHPEQGGSVCALTGRGLLVSAFFGLHAFRFFCQGEFKASRYLLSGLSLALALFSDASAGVVPVLMFLYRWMLRTPVKGRRRLLGPLLPFFLIGAGYLLTRSLSGAAPLFWPDRGAVLTAVMDVPARLLARLSLLIFTAGLSGQITSAVARFAVLFQQNGIFPLVASAAVIALLWLLRRALSAETKFYLVWFAVVSALLPVSGLYLASVGIFAVAALAYGAAYQQDGRKRRAVIQMLLRVLAIGIYAFCLFTVLQQNAVFINDPAQSSAVYKKPLPVPAWLKALRPGRK